MTEMMDIAPWHTRTSCALYAQIKLYSHSTMQMQMSSHFSCFFLFYTQGKNPYWAPHTIDFLFSHFLYIKFVNLYTQFIHLQ